MLRGTGLVILVAAFQVSFQQPPDPYLAGIPSECLTPPKAQLKDCCEIPKLFQDDVLSECGIQRQVAEPPYSAQNCSRQTCVLKKYGLIDEENKIKMKELSKLLDIWVQTNPEYENAMAVAKTTCMTEDGPPGPPQFCEIDKLFYCFTGKILLNCPNWKEGDECAEVQNKVEKCSQYF